MVLGAPETHLTFDYLPKTNNRIIVFGYGAGRINPETPGTYEIHVFLAEPHINDPNLKNFDIAKKYKRYVPLTDFRFFGIGNIFKNQRHVGFNRHGRTFKANELSNHCISDLSFRGGRANLISQHRIIDKVPDYSLRDPYITLTHKGPSIYVPPMESIRFFLSSFGHFGARYISSAESSFNPLDMCDSNATGWVDNETVQISPKGDYCDVSSAVQLAIILTNRDLSQTAASLANLCEKMRQSRKTVTGLFPFPENSENLKFVAIEHFMHVNGHPFSEAWICRRILSDNRSMPFKELEIILPGFDNDTENGEEEETHAPSRSYGSLKSIKIRKGHSNRNKGSFSWGNLPGLIESFPGLEDISLKITRRKSNGGKRNGGRNGPARDITGSSSTERGPVITPAVNFKPPFYSRQMFGGMTHEPGEKRELLQRLIRNMPIAHSYHDIFADLSQPSRERFDTLFDAFSELGKQNHEHLQPIERFVLEAPAEWGGWARINKHRGRYIAGIKLIADSSVNYVFDAELKTDHEAIAIGLIKHTDGKDLGLYDFGCILSHCVARVKLRGQKRKSAEAYIGMWPDETEYCDVTGQRLNHTKKLRHPYFLAKELARVL